MFSAGRKSLRTMSRVTTDNWILTTKAEPFLLCSAMVHEKRMELPVAQCVENIDYLALWRANTLIFREAPVVPVVGSVFSYSLPANSTSHIIPPLLASVSLCSDAGTYCTKRQLTFASNRHWSSSDSMDKHDILDRRCWLPMTSRIRSEPSSFDNQDFATTGARTNLYTSCSDWRWIVMPTLGALDI